MAGIDDAVVTTDCSGRITLMNPVGCRLTGASEAEALGKPFQDFVRARLDEQSADLDRQFRAAIDGREGGPSPVHCTLVSRDGSLTPVECTVTAIRDSGRSVSGVVLLLRDVTEQRRSEAMLRKLSRAVEQSPSTIVITDTSGKIEYVNPRFTDLTGYSREEAIGQNPRILNSGKTPREMYTDLWKTIAAGGEWSGELLNRKKNGELFWEHANICPVRDDKGVVTHYVAIKEDITKRKEVEAELALRAEDLLLAKSRAEEQANRLSIQAFELRKAREEALKASQMKSEFVANMSHEIRTPMNGVLGMTGLLLDTELNDEQKEYAEIIRTSGEALLSIVNDILDFSKIEAGKLELEVIDFNLRTTLEESVDLVAARTREKGLELNYDIADDVPTPLRGDPGRLRQILANLLSNAVKFTERGEIEVDVRRGAGTGDAVTLELVIRDTGIGISELERSRLFKSFSQADGSTTRKHGGTGLGLVIAKQLVEMMGGEIGVRSEKGKGSEFWFTVNLAVQPSSIVAVQDGTLGGIRAIIVDDVGTSRRVLTHLLASWGMRPSAVGGGEEALELIRREAGGADPFRVALIDMQMPGLDGIALARAVASDKALAGLRCLLLTSSGPGSVRDAVAAGMKFCLTKPVKDAALRTCIERALSIRERTATINPGLIAPEDGEDGTVGRAPRRLRRVLVAEDNQVNQRVAIRMLEKMACRADVVANGKEAVEAVAHVPYDMVLMDCQMPEMDGFEATALIRKLPGSARRTLVVAMTASALQGDRERCIASGMDDYLTKPVTQEALGRIMEKWDASLPAGRELREPHAAVKNDGDDPIDPAKIAELREMAGEDDPLWLDTLVRHFLSDVSGRLAGLRSACRDRDAKAFGATAHSLKGSCATMGVTPMELIAGRLEAIVVSGAMESAVPLIDDLERELARAERQLELVLVEGKDAR